MTIMNALTEYVYIMSNTSYGDDVFKIGWTRKHPLKRAIELHTSGIPTPFVVESMITTMEGSKLEKQIHNHLTQYRMNNNREFFKISKDNLTKILTTELNLELTLIPELDDTCHTEYPKKYKCEQKMEENITNNAKHVCKPCQYHCNKKSHYVQHCETEKHKYNAKTFDMHGVRNTQSSDLSIFMKTMMTMQTDLINVLVDVIKNKTIVQSS